MSDTHNTTGKLPSLMTRELGERFKQIGSQEYIKDPIVIAVFFNPCGSETWYATEYDPETKCIFCFVTGMFEDEWGYVSLEELGKIRTKSLGFPIERDLYFTEKSIKDCLKRR